MATTATICSSHAAAEQACRRQYPPSVWGDFFLTHEPCTQEELLSMQVKAQAMKEEVRRIVLAAAASDQLSVKLDLVDALQRLGVDYHYRKEIDDLLHAVYNDVNRDDAPASAGHELYVTSLRFYLLRKHGFNVSSGKYNNMNSTSPLTSVTTSSAFL